jgi:hypothetical protein
LLLDVVIQILVGAALLFTGAWIEGNWSKVWIYGYGQIVFL